MNAGPDIAYRVFLPTGDAELLVVVTHGYFENMKRYREVIERWNARGLAVATYDLRGHGLSEGRRGFIARFTDYIDDLTALLDELGKDTALRKLGRPMLFGHSLGGLISIHGALRAQAALRGLALSSPYLANATKVPTAKLIPGRLLSRLVPDHFDARRRERVRLHAFARDRRSLRRRPHELQEGQCTLVHRERAGPERSARTRLGDSDSLDLHSRRGRQNRQPAASEHFVARVASVDKEYVSLPDNYHEVVNEPDRATTIDRFATAMLRWKSANLSGNGALTLG